jgi:hypothetical protein
LLKKVVRLYVINFSFIVVEIHIKCLAVSGMMDIMHCRTVLYLPGMGVHWNKGMYQLVIVECVQKFQGSVTACGRSQ